MTNEWDDDSRRLGRHPLPSGQYVAVQHQRDSDTILGHGPRPRPPALADIEACAVAGHHGADPERCGCDDSRRLEGELAAVDRALGVTGSEARSGRILALLATERRRDWEARPVRQEQPSRSNGAGTGDERFAKGTLER